MDYFKNKNMRKVSIVTIGLLFCVVMISSCVQGDMYDFYEENCVEMSSPILKHTKDVGGQSNSIPGCTGNTGVLGGCIFRTIAYVVNTRCGKSVPNQTILNCMSQYVPGQTTSSTDFDFYSIRPCIARILSSVSDYSEEYLLSVMLNAKQYDIGGDISSVETFTKPYDAVSSSFSEGDIVKTFNYNIFHIGVGTHTFVVAEETNISYFDFAPQYKDYMEEGPAIRSATDNSVSSKYHKAWINVRIPKEQIDALVQLFN
jgi:hypothetical protein